MPSSKISLASSGGVRSMIRCSALMSSRSGSSSASISSSELTVTARGRPDTRLLPQASISSFAPRMRAEPMLILSSSAVRAPMSRLCFLRR